MAVFQVLVAGGVLFLLYRYLLRSIGSEQLGIWSIVLATASASRISEMGFSASAVKYTARYIARGEKYKASEVIQTTVITIGVVLACVLAGGYSLIAWLLEQIIPSPHFPYALAILPYSLVSVWIGTVASVFLSGLDGCQRIDLRVMVSTSATLLLLLFTWIWVPEYGLVGLAWAQIGQGVFTLFGSLVLLRWVLPELPLLIFKWRSALFREMFHYGFNFQVMSILIMLIDPTTKALMTKFGGLTSVAYYEMASRMVTQFRSLLISANQVMVPHVANLQENAPEEIHKAYLDSYRVVFFLALPLFSAVAIVAPLISEIWIGHYEQSFVTYTILISAAFCINAITAPAYFVNLGTGLLRWNTWSFVAMAPLNAALGYLIGNVLGASGVVLGWTLALMVGSSLVILGYHRDNHLPLTLLFPSESKPLFIACSIGLLAGWALFHIVEVTSTSLMKAGLSMAISISVIVPILWIHPLRKKISHKIAAATRF